MLISVDTGSKVTKLPHARDYARWRKNISDADYDKVVDAINQQVDANDVNTAGWMPGSDWTGTVYEPLYYACGKNEIQSGLFFWPHCFQSFNGTNRLCLGLWSF